MAEQKTATLILVDGTQMPLRKAELTLDKMQKYVGGYIQIVPIKLDGKRVDVVCDEEGKCKGLPINKLATNMYHKAGIIDDILVGNIIFADSGMIE